VEWPRVSPFPKNNIPPLAHTTREQWATVAGVVLALVFQL
jgi:hypothetical protein